MHDTNMEPQALDIRALYMAGRQLNHSASTWKIARKLRGISACAAVLSTEREQTLELGEWLRAGLIEAISELAAEASHDLGGLSENIKAGNYLPK